MLTECSVYPEIYRHQVEELINSHLERNTDDVLLAAVWYDKSNKRGDINLLEIYASFPFTGQGELETFEFPSTADFPLEGKLKITITCPDELRSALLRKDRTLTKIRNAKDRQLFVFSPEGEVIYKEVIDSNA